MGPGSRGLVGWGIAAWSVIGILILLALAVRFVLAPLRFLLPTLLAALLLVYLLNPVVGRLHRRGVPRVWGTLLTYVVVLSALGVGARLLVPALVEQVGGFASQAPALLTKVQGGLDELNRQFHLDLDVREAVANLEPSGTGGRFIARLFAVTVGIVHLLGTALLALLMAFYLLVDLPKILRAAEHLIPVRRREEVHTVIAAMGQSVGGYFRGQLLVASFVGVASALALYVVGLPYWALVGGLAGLFNLIPLIGPFLAGGIALLIAFTTSGSEGLMHVQPGLPLALASGLALLLVQQVDNHIVTPNVIGRTVRLHPVTVMLALLVAGSVAGLAGMLLAVPTLGAAKVLAGHLWRRRGAGGGDAGSARVRTLPEVS